MLLAAVEKALTAFTHSDDRTTIALKGPWGRGKTFYWNHFIRGQARTAPGQGYAYVSLFGLASLADMKRAVALNARALSTLADPSAKTYVEEALAASWLARSLPALAAAAKPYATLFRRFVDVGPILEDLLQREVRDLIVCVDDLERRGDGLRLADVLGYCTDLKERRGCRVVVVLNEDALNEKDAAEFATLSEKVFDHQVVFEPTAKECLTIAFPDADERFVALRAQCEKLRITNIRILQRAKRLMTDFSPYVKRMDASVARRLAISGALYTFCYYSRGGSHPPFEYLKHYRDPMWARLSGSKKATPEEEGWETFLSEYGFRGGDALDEEVVKYLESGVVDSAALRPLLEQRSRELQAAARMDRFTAAWEELFASFDPNATALLAECDAALRAAAEMVDVTFVNALAGLHRTLGEDEAASSIIGAWIAIVREREPAALDLSQRGSPDEVTDPELVAAMHAAHVAQRTPRSLEEVLNKLIGEDGWSEDDVAVLKAAPDAEYERIFRGWRGDRLNAAVPLCLRFAGHGSADAEISEKTIAALRRIAADGPMNAWRVRRFVNL